MGWEQSAPGPEWAKVKWNQTGRDNWILETTGRRPSRLWVTMSPVAFPLLRQHELARRLSSQLHTHERFTEYVELFNFQAHAVQMSQTDCFFYDSVAHIVLVLGDVLLARTWMEKSKWPKI